MDEIRSERKVAIQHGDDHIEITYDPDSTRLVYKTWAQTLNDNVIVHLTPDAQFTLSLDEWQDIERRLDIAPEPCEGDEDSSIVRALADQQERFHEVLSDQGPDNDESMEGSQIYAMLDHIWKRVTGSA